MLTALYRAHAAHGKGNGMQSRITSLKINRRQVLAGSAAGVALGMLPLSASATLFEQMPGRLRKRSDTPHLGKYLCGEVHSKIASKLDDIIADPVIDGEQTALALMEARCPGCRERVHPATSSLSAVIPQWKIPTGVKQGGVPA